MLIRRYRPAFIMETKDSNHERTRMAAVGDFVITLDSYPKPVKVLETGDSDKLSDIARTGKWFKTESGIVFENDAYWPAAANE